MYLSEETFRKNGVRDKSEIHFYTSVPNMFPNCLKYAEKLNYIVKEKNINTHFKHTVKSIDRSKRTVTFDTKEGDVTTEFDLLHLPPPQNAPAFVEPLAAANGWVDVSPETLQHKKYPNVFSIGDVANLPTAKTAAGIFS